MNILLEQEERPKAIIMAGGAGVGKTFVTDKFKKAAESKGWVVLNPDQYARNPDPEQRLSLAAAASKINKEVDSLAKSEDKPNIIWDTTANNPTKVKELQDAGYDVLMIMVYAHPSVAFEQNFARASKEGEDSLPPYVVLKTWASSYNDPHIENYQKMFGDNFIIIDNTSKPGTDNSKIDAFNKAAQQGGKALEKHIGNIINSDPEYYSSTQMVSKPANLSKEQQADFDSKVQQLGLKLEEDDREAMEKLYQKYFEKNNEVMPLKKLGRKNGMEEVYKSYMSKKVKKDAEKNKVYNDISASIKNIGKSFVSIDDATSKAMAHIGQKKINELTQFLVDSILNEEEKPKRTVAIFAGGFKPPTKGHLEVVKKGVELAKKSSYGANIDEINIVVGGGVRDGITQSQSKEIWELYARVFQDQFPIINVIAANPFDYYKDYLRKHPDDQVFVFIGSREGNEGDQADVKFRSEFVKNYSDNVIPLQVPTAAVTSGTEARKYFKENDIEKFKNTLPTGLTVGNVGEIINILNNKSTNSMRKPALKATEPLTPLKENQMSREDFNLVGDVLRNKNKAKKIHDLLLQMFPKQKELLDYNYKNDSYAEFKRVIFHIDKYNIEGPKLIQHTKLKLDPEVYKERDRKYEEYAEGKIKKYFRDSDSDPRTLDLSKLPPITIDSNGEVMDGNHRAFLAIKQQKPLRAYQIVDAKNDHPNVEKILNIVGRKKQEENIDPKSQSKHKGKSAPFGSAYEPVNEIDYNSIFKTEAYLKVNLKKRSQGDILSDIRSLPGVTIVGSKEVPNKPSREESILNIKVDPYPFTKMDDVSAPEAVDYITNEIRKINGVERFQVLKKRVSETKPLNENATYSSKIDYKQQIKDLTKHMIKKGMNILPLPRVIFKHSDIENASQFLGKTAYYSPSDMTVVLYTEGRHPKDIARSFAHEMIHHIQNLEGRLEDINTTNTMEDDNLNDIEREAYTRGNMVFRNWTDNMDGEEVSSLNEKIVGEKIECDNCSWSWNIVDGGDDLYMCHKCGHDNEPENGDPFGLKAYARELMEDFNIEDIKPATKSLEEQKRVRIFTTNCGCDKT